jgi:secondary thiamine-phosphate synthase enzyme
VDSRVLDIDTTGKTFIDLTGSVTEFCAGRGDGLCSVFVPHATAGVAVMELHAGSEEDLEEVLSRILPRDDRWRHRHGSPGHGADHVLPALVSPSVVLPVIDGKPALGTWQYVVMVDTNHDNPQRQLRLSFLVG